MENLIHQLSIFLENPKKHLIEEKEYVINDIEGQEVYFQNVRFGIDLSTLNLNDEEKKRILKNNSIYFLTDYNNHLTLFEKEAHFLYEDLNKKEKEDWLKSNIKLFNFVVDCLIDDDLQKTLFKTQIRKNFTQINEKSQNKIKSFFKKHF